MKKSRYTEAQVIATVKQMEAGRKARERSRELGVSEATLQSPPRAPSRCPGGCCLGRHRRFHKRTNPVVKDVDVDHWDLRQVQLR
jgi:hypothetical protein